MSIPIAPIPEKLQPKKGSPAEIATLVFLVTTIAGGVLANVAVDGDGRWLVFAPFGAAAFIASAAAWAGATVARAVERSR
jgi:hypothetical protein